MCQIFLLTLPVCFVIVVCYSRQQFGALSINFEFIIFKSFSCISSIWNLTFDHFSGVKHTPAPIYSYNSVPLNGVNLTGKCRHEKFLGGKKILQFRYGKAAKCIHWVTYKLLWWLPIAHYHVTLNNRNWLHTLLSIHSVHNVWNRFDISWVTLANSLFSCCCITWFYQHIELHSQCFSSCVIYRSLSV